MKKVSFIAQQLAGGGAERVVSVLANELANDDSLDISVVTFFPVENEYALNSEINKVSLFSTEEEYRNASRILRIKNLRRFIKQNNIQVLFPFLWFVGVYTFIATLGLDVKLVQTVRNNPALVPGSKLGRFARNLTLLFSWKGFVQSNEQKEYFWKPIRDKLFVITNPVSSVFLETTATVDRSNTIVMAGRLEPQKNYPLALSAFKILKSRGVRFNVEIYGQGSLETALAKRIQEENLGDRVRLCGRSSHLDKEYSRSSIYVLTSDFEGMPNSLMEAMASGLACVATDCPTGPAQLINHGVTGFLIEQGNFEKLANVLETLLEDAELRKQVGISAKKYISQTYAPKVIAKKVVDNFLQ